MERTPKSARFFCPAGTQTREDGRSSRKNMKTDFELVREILLAVGENEDVGRRGFTDIHIPGRTREEVSSHVKFMHEAELIEAVNLSTLDGREWKPMGLTGRGREFLALARDDGLWEKAEKKLGKKKNSFLGALKQMLFDLVTSVLGL